MADADEAAPTKNPVKRYTVALARTGTLKYVAQKQAVLASHARESTCCARFIHTLRFLNVLGALAIFATAIVLTVLASIHIANADALCSDAQTTDCFNISFTAARHALVYIVIAVVFFFFAGLTIAADGCACRCVARFFGFMAYNVFKGIFSIFCGLAVAWIGNEYKKVDPDSSAAVTADIALFIVGMINCGVGVMYVLFGSCNCISVASTPLKKEFHDYKVALRLYHEVCKKDGEPSETKEGTKMVTIEVTAGKSVEAKGAKKMAAEEDVSSTVDTNPFAIAIEDDEPPAASAD